MSFDFLNEAVTGPAVNFKNLSLKMGNTEILKNITFTIESGEVHAIIGPNGGGKTSLIRSLLGETPHTGTIELGWESSVGKIGYVPQFLNIEKNIPLTVEDFLAVSVQKLPAFLGLDKKHRPAVERALSAVGMIDKKKYVVNSLSGGEKQRVLIAQSLIPTPSFLIFDEPLSSIDTSGSDMFESLLTQISEYNITVLLVHHDLKQVRKVADRVTCINKELIFSGKPDEVMDESHLLEIFSAKAAHGEGK